MLTLLVSCGDDDDAATETTAAPTVVASTAATSSSTPTPTSSGTTAATDTTATSSTAPATTAAPDPVGRCERELLTPDEVVAVTGDPVVEVRESENAGWRQCIFDSGPTARTVSRFGFKPIDPVTFEAARDDYVREIIGVDATSVEPYSLGDAAFLVTTEVGGDPLLSIVFVSGTTAVGVSVGVVGGDPTAVRSIVEELAAIAAGRV